MYRCDGYLPEPTPKSALVHPIQPRVHSTQLPRVLFSTTYLHDEDLYFQLFQDVVAAELSGYFNPRFWIDTVLQEGRTVLPIKHAIIAITALRQSQSIDANSNSVYETSENQENPSGHRQIAITHYLKGVHLLKEYILGPDGPHDRTALIAYIIFACFEKAQGNNMSSFWQLTEGIKLVQNYALHKSRDTSQAFVDYHPNPFHNRIQRFSDDFSMQDQMALHLPGRPNNTAPFSRAISEPLFMNGVVPEIVVLPESSTSHAAQNMGRESFNQGFRELHDMQESDQNLWDFYLTDDYAPDLKVHDEFEPLRQPPTQQAKIHPGRSRRVPPALSFQLASGSSSQSPVSIDTPSWDPSPRSTPAAGNISSASSARTATPPVPNPELPIEDILIQEFVRLLATDQIVSLGDTHTSEQESGIQELCRKPIPLSFLTFEAAHQSWDFLRYRVHRFCYRTLYDQKSSMLAHEPFMPLDTYISFMAELNDFARAFRPYLDAAVDFSGKIHNPGALLICMHHKVALANLTAVAADSEMAYDGSTTIFHAVVKTASFLISSYPTLNLPRNPNFSFNSGVVVPLFMVAMKCRNPALRREAINLLADNPRTEGMWNSTVCARIGEYIMELEEEAHNLHELESFHMGSEASVLSDDALLPHVPHHGMMDHDFTYPTSTQTSSFNMYPEVIMGKNPYGTARERSHSDSNPLRPAMPGQQARARYHSSADLMTLGSESATWTPAVCKPSWAEAMMQDMCFARPQITAAAAAPPPPPASWNVERPILEKDRFRISRLEWHTTERFVKVVCEKCVAGLDGLRELRERIIRW
ncbi:C6 zinc finger domain protein [Phlyctema vagabunda]|uniref:C6 zinc finger domain protein n=1 Tax=Phlyctema vagabunda TaxID=108571 RepID=A0ABR4PC69_9HELO